MNRAVRDCRQQKNQASCDWLAVKSEANGKD
jgi:hypothetical protein